MGEPVQPRLVDLPAEARAEARARRQRQQQAALFGAWATSTARSGASLSSAASRSAWVSQSSRGSPTCRASLLAPEPSKASAISGPTTSPSAWVPNTIPTSLPRSFRFAYSLTMTALTG